MEEKQQNVQRLEKWKGRLQESDQAYKKDLEAMDDRERFYNGEAIDKDIVAADKARCKNDKKVRYVRNIVFENIETQVSSVIPQPKVTALHKEDEELAMLLEYYIRSELDRLPFERINDMAERTVLLQGGVGYFAEWDNSVRKHASIGALQISQLHPKQFGPQPGVFTGIEDMDWFIVKLPTTKEAIRRRYGKSVYQEGEAEPELRTTDGGETEKDAITQYIGFERNDSGGINKYAWVNDVELEDLENYQARRLPVCTECGKVKPAIGQEIVITNPETGETKPIKYSGGKCPYCGGGKFEDREQEYEEIYVPFQTAKLEIPGAQYGMDEMGIVELRPTKIPYYKPTKYPIVLQRSVSVYGKLLGNSDVDQMKDQQIVTNRLEQKIIDRIFEAGSRVSLPKGSTIDINGEDGKVWRIDPKDRQSIGVYTFSGDLTSEMAYLARVYNEPREMLGITDSFQGRRDPTATSGVAKQQSASQAAGRLESKRIMKNAAYAEIFELMFQYFLAYSDEPRRVAYKNFKGETEYTEISRYDFLKKDEDGQYYWEDDFLFSCDTSAPLAANRETMWQETRMNLQTGAFGNPADLATLILFWQKMQDLHYPGAASTKKYLEDKLAQQQEQAQQAAQQTMTAQNTMPGVDMAGSAEAPTEAGIGQQTAGMI